MINRCRYPSKKEFKDYGGRGIFVCERWQSFESFYADMGEPPPTFEIDRINNLGPYAPDNCRWVSRIENQRNKRTNVVIEAFGRRQCLKAWAEEFGLAYHCLRSRLRYGWTSEQALTGVSPARAVAELQARKERK